MTPEEERLQNFWHDYYDALKNYYCALDHIDWVAYYKNHGYQINARLRRPERRLPDQLRSGVRQPDHAVGSAQWVHERTPVRGGWRLLISVRTATRTAAITTEAGTP